MVNKWVYLFINGVYWGYNLLTNHLLTSWDIQTLMRVMRKTLNPGEAVWEVFCSIPTWNLGDIF